MNRLLKPTILSISLLTVMAGAAVSPALGSISENFSSASPETIKMILSLPAITIMIFAYISGRLANTFSKRHILIAGLMLYLLGGVGAAFTTTIHQLLIFRAILGVGVGLIMPLSVAIIADFYEGAQRTQMIGLSPAISCLGGVLASFLGGLLAAMNWRYAFGIYLLALPSLCLSIMVLPNTTKNAGRPGHKNTGVKLPQQVYILAVLQFLLMLVFFAVPCSLATFMQYEGIGNAAWAGLALAVLNIFGFLGGMLFVRLLKWFHQYILPGAIVFMLAGFLLLGWAQHFSMILISVAALGFGFGILQPLIYWQNNRIVHEQETAMALSLISSFLFLGQFMSPILLTGLATISGNNSSRLSFWGLALLLAISFCLALLYGGKTSPKSE